MRLAWIKLFHVVADDPVSILECLDLGGLVFRISWPGERRATVRGRRADMFAYPDSHFPDAFRSGLVVVSGAPVYVKYDGLHRGLFSVYAAIPSRRFFIVEVILE